MLTHGIGMQYIYTSLYGIVNVVNRKPSLVFNMNGAEFPFHNEQREIVGGFHKMSGVSFGKIILAIDDILVWTTKLTKADSDF